MKFKAIITFLLIYVCMINPLAAQTAEGDWYTPLRNKLLHVTVSSDSIVLRKCSFDSLKDSEAISEAFRVEKKINTDYIVYGKEDVDTLAAYYVFKFRLEAGRNYLHIESFNEAFPSVTAAENAIAALKPTPFDIILLDRQSINKIKLGRDITAMTVNDFKDYASKISAFNTAYTDYPKKKYKLTYINMESTARILLSETGINGLVKGNLYDTTILTFRENPETKALFFKTFGE